MNNKINEIIMNIIKLIDYNQKTYFIHEFNNLAIVRPIIKAVISQQRGLYTKKNIENPYKIEYENNTIIYMSTGFWTNFNESIFVPTLTMEPGRIYLIPDFKKENISVDDSYLEYLEHIALNKDYAA